MVLLVLALVSQMSLTMFTHTKQSVSLISLWRVLCSDIFLLQQKRHNRNGGRANKLFKSQSFLWIHSGAVSSKFRICSHWKIIQNKLSRKNIITSYIQSYISQHKKIILLLLVVAFSILFHGKWQKSIASFGFNKDESVLKRTDEIFQ